MVLQNFVGFCGRAAIAALALYPLTAQAQQAGDGPAAAELRGGTVFDGDFVTVGVGVGLGPSYTGSDNYVVSPLPIVFGSVGGVNINPRPAGLALDLIPDADDAVGFAFGPAGRLRSDRNNQIADDVVASLGELDRAIELGVSGGIRVPQVLHGFDSVTVNTDVLWDVNGAHGGMVVSPSVTYFTPLSRAVAASLSLNADFADGDFHDFYFAVSPEQETATNSAVTAFDPDGGGLVSVGASLLLGIDLDGDITNGGWGIVTILGYSRVTGDARRTPLTATRGSADQGFVALGIGYTF